MEWTIALTGGPLDGVVTECEVPRAAYGYYHADYDGKRHRYVSYLFTGKVSRLKTIFARFDREVTRPF